jgi:hypothetical protein
MSEVTETPTGNGRVVPTMMLPTSKLIGTLRDGPIGATRTDEELSRIAERDTRVGGNGYGYLQSAIRHVLRHHQLVWKRIPGAGAIRCLGGSETITYARSRTKGIARSARRTVQQLRAVERDVAPETQSEYLVTMAVAGTLQQLASDSGRKKLEARGIDSPLDLGKLLVNMNTLATKVQ